MDTDSNSSVASSNPSSVESPPPARSSGKRYSRWIVWAVITILLAGGVLLSQRTSGSKAGVAGNGKTAKGRAGGAIPVAVATVQKGNMGDYISALGTVTSVYTVSLTSRVAGTLVSINYHEGEMVRKGQLLAVIDPRPYEASYLQAQGQLQRDQALLANARIDVARYSTAFQQHAVPEQTLATQQAVVNQDEGTVKIDEGNLAAAKVNFDYAQIRAPIDGRVGLRQIDPGNIVQANGTTPLLTITQLQPITVIFTMAEDYIYPVVSQLRSGHKLRVDALSRDNQTELAQGTLLTIDNQVDTTTGTVRARATFANRDYKLFPNEFVNAKLLVRTLMGVNIIPNAAIQRNNDVAFVYVVNANKTVQSRNISVATTDGNNSAVTGVKPGEVLVTDGFDKLQEGAKVAPRKSSPAPPSGPAEQANQAQENMQPPTQGDASTHLNTAQQNPQQPQKGRHK
ncbi:MAG: efflux RND transporter periplasmic adaptor subunit [Acidobacteriota bacterium]|nr:efflux RND transporter periplasmic adaptor subunit [Acidobacteriota bacterium]